MVGVDRIELEGKMAILTVALIGAVIGVAFTLFDFSWGVVRYFASWIGYHPATVLTLSAVGGAVVVSAEFWAVTALWAALG